MARQSPEADLVLARRNDDIFVIPDILCNAGSVIVSYFEWVQGLQQYFWSKDEVMGRLEEVLSRSWSQVVTRAKRTRSRTAPRRWRSASSGCVRANLLAAYFPRRLRQRPANSHRA
jgi:glutamate dehydrogenase/leucine dehydrogenase